jgi:DNA invertase Pin-like site-specific DNA recombinase
MRVKELFGTLDPGRRLVVSELSRLDRSLGQVIQTMDELVRRKVRFTAVKEMIRFDGKQDLQTKVRIALFGLFAEAERDLISERAKEGLAAARAMGRRLIALRGWSQQVLPAKKGSPWTPIETCSSVCSLCKQI